MTSMTARIRKSSTLFRTICFRDTIRTFVALELGSIDTIFSSGNKVETRNDSRGGRQSVMRTSTRAESRGAEWFVQTDSDHITTRGRSRRAHLCLPDDVVAQI